MLKKLMITTALTGLMIGTAAAQSTNPSSGAQQSNPPAVSKQETTPPPVSQQSSPPRGDMKSSAMSQPKIVSTQKPDQFLASKFKGTDVLGADNQKVGSVNDILFDKDGKIEAYVISVGGFLGIGAKDVALSPDSFTIVAGDKSKNEFDKLKLAMSNEQLKSAANFEPYNPPRATTGIAPSDPIR